MPPKTKKASAAAKAKIIDDKTFGLKNKKGAKNQKYIAAVVTNVKTAKSKDEKMREQEMNERKDKKANKKDFEAEMAKLFNAVADAPKEKDGEKTQAEEDGYDPDAYLWRAEDFEDVGEDDSRLEEKLEAEREALKDRTDLTPVTEESFQAWKTKKRLEAAALEKARLSKAKKSNTLRGWDLWQENKDLFVDDDEADEFYEREESEEYDEEEEEEEGGAAKHVDPTK